MDDDDYRDYRAHKHRVALAAMLWEQGVPAELLWRKCFMVRDGKQKWGGKQKSFMAQLLGSLESRRHESLKEARLLDGPSDWENRLDLIVLYRWHDLRALTGECTW